MKMKRYNIHFPTEWDKELDKITEKINKARKDNGHYGEIKKADTIRIAIAMQYNLRLCNSYNASTISKEIIEKLFKK